MCSECGTGDRRRGAESGGDAETSACKAAEEKAEMEKDEGSWVEVKRRRRQPWKLEQGANPRTMRFALIVYGVTLAEATAFAKSVLEA
jgi:hypothetical protein